jgi:DNA-binding MarR family transcriptional regulator
MVLKEFGITQTQFALLASLKWFEEHAERPTQSHLAAHTRIDKMTVSKAIKKLEALGMVTRHEIDADKRANTVHFAALGRQIVGKAIAGVEDADDAFFGALTKADLDEYKRLSLCVIRSNA